VPGREFGIRTQSIHRGTAPDPMTGAIAPAISPSANLVARIGEVGSSAASTEASAAPLPTLARAIPRRGRSRFRLALLDHGDDAVVFGTGMPATSTRFNSLTLAIISSSAELRFEPL
jgi:cystathionine beta-lyase/cystathionine gamma-synthase